MQGWSKVRVKQIGEVAPWQGALFLLDPDNPELGTIFKIVGGYPHLLLLRDALLSKLGLIVIDENKWIGLAIKDQTWETPYSEMRRSIIVMLSAMLDLGCQCGGDGVAVLLPLVHRNFQGCHGVC